MAGKTIEQLDELAAGDVAGNMEIPVAGGAPFARRLSMAGLMTWVRSMIDASGLAIRHNGSAINDISQDALRIQPNGTLAANYRALAIYAESTDTHPVISAYNTPTASVLQLGGEFDSGRNAEITFHQSNGSPNGKFTSYSGSVVLQCERGLNLFTPVLSINQNTHLYTGMAEFAFRTYNVPIAFTTILETTPALTKHKRFSATTNSDFSRFVDENENILTAIRKDGQVYSTADFISDDAAKGLILKSPNGHYWRQTVDNSGVITTTDLGTALPA